MAAAADTTMVDTAADVDEDLYSRQLYVMGHEAQRRMGASSVLICGLNGVGVEIAKNVILAGVQSVTLYDPEPAQWADLSAQFYLSAADVEAGTGRAAACAEQLAELNQYVRVTAHTGAFDNAFVGTFTAVVMVGATEAQHVSLNAFCRASGVAYIAADARGLFGGVFVDLGDAFVVSDATGEAPTSCMIASVIAGTDDAEDKSNPAGADEALVTVVDDARHNLETGDFVDFTELVGLEALNAAEPAPVRVVGPFSFVIKHDLRALEPHVRGGYVHQVKQPKTFAFQSYAEARTMPKEGTMTGDISKWGRADLLHLGFRALDTFRAAHGGVCPAPGSVADAAELVAGAHAINSAAAEGEHKVDAAAVDEKILTALAMGSSGVIAPMAAFLGGVVGQEVLKACGGKFTPLNGFWYFDAVECLPDDFPLPEAEYKAQGARYDGQIAVFGSTLQAHIGALNYFIVGAGAIGCEMLKNWALMGVGSAEGGHVTVTDMDCIEKSNLNRQFLFRPGDVKQLKSQCAARAVVAMNPSMRVTALDLRVGSETETVFNDAFYSNLNAVCTALDNVDARLYVDQRCLFYQLPMMESGTEGPKGNTQIVVPRATENYGASRDPPEKSIPICTLKNFPNAIEHTLQWARDWFEGVFNQTAADANAYLSHAGFLAQLQAQQNTKLETLDRIHQSLVTDKAIKFEDCVVWARLRFEDMFSSDMKQLLHNFPLDQMTTAGQPFWSGTKRPPQPMAFDAEDPLHMAFIVAAANLRAENFGLAGLSRDPAVLKPILAGVTVPDFVPKRGLKIASTEAEAKEQGGAAAAAGGGLDVDAQCDKILSELPPPGELAGFRLSPVEFEKDDDAHMDMITACSNLRARNYKITEADKHKSKLIAGKIIPAIATTTALVTGLVCLEAYKLMVKKPIEAYRNNFVNLALGFMASSEPQPVETQTSIIKGKEWKWSVWDCIDVDKGDITMGEFIDIFETEYELDVSMISFGVSILFSFFGNAKKMKERRKMKMTEVVAEVTKKPVNPTAMFLIFELCVSDASGGDNDGEDVDIPYVRMKIKD